MLFLIGALAGFAYGFSAFGASVLAVALLNLLLATPLGDAMAMNLCMLVVMATITAGDGVRARLPVPGMIWPFALVAAVAVPAGVWISTVLGDAALEPVFILLLIVLAVVIMLLVQRTGAIIAWPRGGLAALKPLKLGDADRPQLSLGLPLFGGGLGGLFAGLFGASGTLFLVPALGRVFSARPGQAVACAEMAMLPALLAAVITSLLLERVIPWQATGLMIFGALAGLSLARMLAPRCSTFVCHALVAGALLITAGFGIWMD